MVKFRRRCCLTAYQIRKSTPLFQPSGYLINLIKIGSLILNKKREEPKRIDRIVGLIDSAIAID